LGPKTPLDSWSSAWGRHTSVPAWGRKASAYQGTSSSGQREARNLWARSPLRGGRAQKWNLPPACLLPGGGRRQHAKNSPDYTRGVAEIDPPLAHNVDYRARPGEARGRQHTAKIRRQHTTKIPGLHPRGIGHRSPLGTQRVFARTTRVGSSDGS